MTFLDLLIGFICGYSYYAVTYRKTIHKRKEAYQHLVRIAQLRARRTPDGIIRGVK